MRFSTIRITGLLTACVIVAKSSAGIVISFNYGDDNISFFTAEAKTTLAAAATSLTSRINDTLDAIQNPGGTFNTYSINFPNPWSGSQVTLNEPGIIPANTLNIYVGARDLDSISTSTLGYAAIGGQSVGYAFTTTGTNWLRNATTRGETGAPNTDYSTWGGAISFDTGRPWYFDQDTSGTADVPGGQIDFYSVAVHEIGHVLGIASEVTSWANQITSGKFGGATSTSLHGGQVTLESDQDHWMNGTTYGGQETAMDPSLTGNARKHFTELDFAGLKDIGWEVTVTPVPEPQQLSLIAALLLVGYSQIHRRNRP